MVVIQIDTIGDERLVRGFDRISSDIKDFREPFDEIYRDFLDMEKQIFTAEGTPEGFVALSPKYARWKQKHYPGKKIMQLSGRLMKALTAEDQTSAKQLVTTVKKIEKTEAEFGAKGPYVHRHQMGTHGMPQRKIVQVTDARKVRWVKIIQAWAMGVIDRGLGEPMWSRRR